MGWGGYGNIDKYYVTVKKGVKGLKENINFKVRFWPSELYSKNIGGVHIGRRKYGL